MSTKHFSLMGLDILFLGAVFVASQIGGKIAGWEFIPLALATFRLARSISFNEIFEWLRRPFCVVIPDSCKAGANVHPKYEHGIQAAIGGLLSCPVCTGTWSALVLFSLYMFLPSFGHYLVYILAIAGASEIIHYGAEILEWGGRHARVAAGAIAPDKEGER